MTIVFFNDTSYQSNSREVWLKKTLHCIVLSENLMLNMPWFTESSAQITAHVPGPPTVQYRNGFLIFLFFFCTSPDNRISFLISGKKSQQICLQMSANLLTLIFPKHYQETFYILQSIYQTYKNNLLVWNLKALAAV